MQPENLLQEKVLRSYVHSENIAFWFNQSFIMEAFSLMFIGYKVINVFRINRKVDVILSSIEKVNLLI